MSENTAATSVKQRLLSVKEAMIDFPLFILGSPFKGFDEMKTYNRGSMKYAFAIIVIFCLVQIWGAGGMGFIAAGFHVEYAAVNVPGLLLFVLAPIVLICIANWSITSITNGKGKLREIFLVYTYALFPMVVCLMIAITLSNFVTANELAFVTFFFGFGSLLMYFYLFLGLLVIHEFSFLKGVLMVFLTMLSMVIIVFVISLFLTLLSELIIFITTVFRETEALLF